MITRLYTVADYASLQPWWQGRWGGAPSVHALPQSGMIASLDGRDIAAGWLYLDMTSPIALLAFLVTHPDNARKHSVQGLKVIIEGLKELAKSQGRVHMITICPKGSLGRLLRRCGFQEQDTDIEHLTLNLEQWQQE